MFLYSAVLHSQAGSLYLYGCRCCFGGARRGGGGVSDHWVILVFLLNPLNADISSLTYVYDRFLPVYTHREPRFIVSFKELL